MLRKTVVARALTIAFGTAVLSAAVVAPAMAQSNTTGTIYGKVAPGAALGAPVGGVQPQVLIPLSAPPGGAPEKVCGGNTAGFFLFAQMKR
jgi:hypothetical protein